MRARGPGLLLGLVLGLLALGPGIGRGFLLSYDMVFVPRESFAAALPGLDPARAVPSDLVVAVASRVLPADIVQKILLLAIFMLAAAGVAALLDNEAQVARLAGAACYAWNPYVAERLIIGQWALLLGYAGLPWVLRALREPDLATGKGAARLAVALLPAVIGGFAAMAVTAVLLVPVALCTRSIRSTATAITVAIIGCLPFLIPSLLHPVFADPSGVAAFAARADTPFGSVGSLLMLGGMWNADTVPKAYGGPWSALWLVLVVIAIAGAAVSLRRWPGLGIAAVAGLVIACLGLTGPGRDLLRSWNVLSVARDGQQFVAPLALAVATGFGVAVNWAVTPRPFGVKDGAGVMLGVFALIAPVVLLPGLAWGAAGRLRPAAYPADWLAAARTVDASPAPGDVLLLPWVADRTPYWNHGETMLDPWPRLLSRPVIWNDGTLVGSLALLPDDPRARQLDGAIGGSGPLTGVLRAAGISFVVDGGPPAGARLPGAVVIVDVPGLVIYRLPG